MALTIDLAGSGSRANWVLNVGAFFAGTLLGGLASAALVIAGVSALSSFLPRSLLIGAICSAIGLAAVREVGIPVPVPYRTKQVPEWWRSVMPLRTASFAYGVLLGLGFATPFTSSAHMATVLSLPLLGSTSHVIMVIAVLAFGRILPLFIGVRATSRQAAAEGLASNEWHGRSRMLARRLPGIGASAVIVASLVHSSGRSG